MALVADLSLILLAALAGGFLAQRVGQPLMVGYVLAGVLVGPFTGSEWRRKRRVVRPC